MPPRSGRERDRARKLHVTLQTGRGYRSGEHSACPGEHAGPADDYVGKRAAAGCRAVRVARARALTVAERLVQQRSAGDVDGAQVAPATAASAERDRLGRVAVGDDDAGAAEAAVGKVKRRTAAPEV